MEKCWIAFLLFLVTYSGCPSAAKPSSRGLPSIRTGSDHALAKSDAKRFMRSIDEESKAKIDAVIAELREKFGEVDPGFFDKLKETITSIPEVKDKIDSIISGIFDLFGGDKSEEHEISPEEKAFRLKFNQVLEEMMTKVPIAQAKRFMPSIDEESKAKIDAAIDELREKFGEVDPGFFDKLKETITSIPGKVKDKIDSIISGIFDLFGGNKSEEHEISPEEKAFRLKFNQVLEEMMTKVRVAQAKRFMPSIDEESKAKIDAAIDELKEKFGEVDPGFFDKLKETITNIPGKIKDKIDSIISGIFDLFGGNKAKEHVISPEEKAFRKKFDKVLQEMMKKVTVTEAKRFMPSVDEENKARIDKVIAQLKEKFGDVDPGFFDKLKETITSIPGKIKDKIDSIISGIFDLFGGNKPEHVISPEEKAFRLKFDQVLAELMKKNPEIEE